MQHLISKYREEDVVDENVSAKDLLHRSRHSVKNDADTISKKSHTDLGISASKKGHRSDPFLVS